MVVRVDAGERLRRLLAVLTWLARRQRAPIEELADRFGMTAAELVADLELAACCGLPPYSPDQLMEIVVDEDEVVAHLGPELARARRLSAAEGFALAAAARAITAVSGGDPDGALERALVKLDAALGERGGLLVDLDEPPHLAAVRAAADAGRQLELDYHSASRDERTRRVVDPHRVTAIEGHWYLDGYCHRAGGLRRFRVDRILDVRPTGSAVFHPPADGTGGAGPADGDERPSDAPFVPGPDNTVVRVAVDPGAAWVADAVPLLGRAERSDGRVELTLAVTSPVWFGRLLLRLGPAAEVLEPSDMAGAGAEAAASVLTRYRSGRGAA